MFGSLERLVLGVALGGIGKAFDYTFKQAHPAGKLEFACHLPGH